MVQALETGLDTQIELIGPEQYEYYWPSIERELDFVPHIWEPWFSKSYLRDIPMHREMLVWGASVKGAVTIVIMGQFIHTPRGKGLCFYLAFGNGLETLLPRIEATFERLAQVMECDFVEIRGREGWLRKLPGFHRDYTVMSKPIYASRVQ